MLWCHTCGRIPLNSNHLWQRWISNVIHYSKYPEVLALKPTLTLQWISKYAQTLKAFQGGYRCSILQQRLMRFRDEAKEARRTLRSTCDPALTMDARGEVKEPVIKASGDAFTAADEALVAISSPSTPLAIPSKPLPRPCHKALHTFCNTLGIRSQTWLNKCYYKVLPVMIHDGKVLNGSERISVIWRCLINTPTMSLSVDEPWQRGIKEPGRTARLIN